MTDYIIKFAPDFDERSAWEAEGRGYLSHVTLVLRGKSYSLVFYDCCRLAQDLEHETESGRGCLAEPGLIVLNRITIENIERAVESLVNENYFDYLRPNVV